VQSNIRARAFSLQASCIHIFGGTFLMFELTPLQDAISPTIIGLISDRTGDLTYGTILVPVTMFLASLVWGIGWRDAPENSVEMHYSSVEDNVDVDTERIAGFDSRISKRKSKTVEIPIDADLPSSSPIPRGQSNSTSGSDN
jgi:hypothetical protein